MLNIHFFSTNIEVGNILFHKNRSRKYIILKKPWYEQYMQEYTGVAFYVENNSFNYTRIYINKFNIDGWKKLI